MVTSGLKICVRTPMETVVETNDYAMVTFRGREGQIGVLEGHQPMMVQLREGVVALYPAINSDHPGAVWKVMEGLVHITPHQVDILTSKASVGSIDTTVPQREG